MTESERTSHLDILYENQRGYDKAILQFETKHLYLVLCYVGYPISLKNHC